MSEVLEEMSWDVQRWLLVLPQTRVPEARGLLRSCPRWLLLSTCDHDGVIACYRTLKGLTDLWPTGPAVDGSARGGPAVGGPGADKPILSLALLDAMDHEQAEKVSAKLVSVCEQFLSWPLEAEPNVRADGPRVAEHLVMCCRPTRDKSEVAAAPQWEIVADLIARSRQSDARRASEPLVATAPAEPIQPEASTLAAGESTATPMPNIPSEFKPVMRVVPMDAHHHAPYETSCDDELDVIDLPADAVGGDLAIVEAVLRHSSSGLVECPIAPPMCPGARLAVGRDRRIVMLAVPKHGLADLSTIGQGYKWLRENQALIGMAMPQFAIDPQQPPQLKLLINQTDTAADTLRPMLQGDQVTVKTYRKLRWGGKTGLLLEAA